MPSCWTRTTCVPVTGRIGSREVSTAIVGLLNLESRLGHGTAPRRLQREPPRVSCARQDYTWSRGRAATSRAFAVGAPVAHHERAWAPKHGATQGETRHDGTLEEPRLARTDRRDRARTQPADLRSAPSPLGPEHRPHC